MFKTARKASCHPPGKVARRRACVAFKAMPRQLHQRHLSSLAVPLDPCPGSTALAGVWLIHRSHAAKDALIRALWAQVQSLTDGAALEVRLDEQSKTPDKFQLAAIERSAAERG